MKDKPKLIVIVGPTASGKSGLGIRLAQKFNGEIISADSRQVYKGMDIGTGKVSKQEQRIVRHHLIDVASPRRQFTASDFKKIGNKALGEIISNNKIPIIVGGTGFYIDALLNRVDIPEVPPNKKLRAKLEKQSAEQLFSRLQELGPNRAKTIEPKNKRRLIRAIEIAMAEKLSSEKSVIYHDRVIKQTQGYELLWIGLRPDNLEKQIKIRLDKRLKQGMVKEVENLKKNGLSWKRLYDFGLEYRQISEFLKNKKSKIKNQNYRSNIKDFKSSGYYERLLREIIKYSKRQMTWFKRNKEIVWLRNPKDADQIVKKFLTGYSVG